MRPGIGRVGDADSPQEWFQSLPILTKIILSSAVILAAAVNFNLVSAYDLAFNWSLIYGKFQIWRLFSCFLFVGTFSFNFLMHVYMLYQNCYRYEINPFNTGAGGTSSDFLWMLLFGICVLSFIATIFSLPFLGEPFLYLIMYVWCRREPEAVLNIFGFKFKALYLPWIYVAIKLLMGSDIIMALFGIGTGHLYFFLVEILPSTHGFRLIKTPQFCIDFVQWITGMTQPQNAGFTATAPNDNLRGDRSFQTGRTWGPGRVLGTN